MAVVLAVGGLIFLGGLTYWFGHRGRLSEQSYFHTNCPGCRQRLRFPERQAGRPSACPRCKKLLTLPAKSAFLPVAK